MDGTPRNMTLATVDNQLAHATRYRYLYSAGRMYSNNDNRMEGIRASRKRAVAELTANVQSRWHQAEGHHPLGRVPQPSERLGRRRPRRRLQHLPPHQVPDLLLATRPPGRLLRHELGYRAVRSLSARVPSLERATTVPFWRAF